MLKDFEFLIDYRATDTEAEIFWDLPLDADPDCEYLVVNNSADETIKTKKTHASLSGLIPESQIDISVYIVYSDKRADHKNDPVLLGQFSLQTAKTKKKIDITAAPYNAVGDGKSINTEAIQAALDACDKDSFIYIPAGTFLTGALNVHSDTEIYLEEEALLQGTENPEDYLPKIWSRFEGHEMECYRSLLNLGELDHDADYNCKNVVIRGKGSIMGGGAALAKAIARTEGERLRDYIASLGDKIKEYEKPETIASRFRGRLINMSNCQNIWIHGLTLGYGPAWNLHFIYSDQIVTDHCTIKSEGIWNGDGWDPDSSTNSTIYACDFYTEDDSVAIKSGKNPEGNVINRPTKHIRVFDCITNFGHGLCIGSEMSGGVEDVRLWDCQMGPTWSGIEIKATKKRGSYVKNILVRDITASHIQMHSVGYNDDGEGSKVPPLLSDCHFERMHLLGRFLDNNAGKNEWHDCPSILLCGFDVPGYEIKNISFKDIEMEEPAEGADSIHMEYCEGITFENMKNIIRKT
ncbi:MAG: glycoside hydrolase family 28 protein [Butyrivibrio sp.]|jgi:polygalacturonase|uniref:glycoside hydrolase family 28 protein n=1 Tax=Butyrivibrio sp. TaxID=28121 RepID=UPI001ED294F9|nr:glycosyl hydrolase family 28 protein [Butyrivibrio sp.]MBE5841167.1 glycoside hydrolase family 28 protein [Butyrivibrio sp.]